VLGRGRGWALPLALALVTVVLMLPPTPSGANPYAPTPDPGTVPIIYTVNTIQHMTIAAAEATVWPPVIGQVSFVRWDITLQEDITSGKVVYNFTGPNGPISGVYPVCGAARGSISAVIPADGPNVTAGPMVWPIGTPASTSPVPCPIVAGTYNTGLVPFAISKDVQPGTYAGTILVVDQSGAVIMRSSWQIVLSAPRPEPPTREPPTREPPTRESRAPTVAAAAPAALATPRFTG
jgi:hypothetical protein